MSLTDLQCPSDDRTLLVSALYRKATGIHSQEEMCNKLEKNGVLKHFTGEQEWETFYNRFTDWPALVRECWQGGRKLVWMPYVDRDGDFVFHHMVTGEPVYPPNGAWMNGKVDSPLVLVLNFVWCL